MTGGVLVAGSINMDLVARVNALPIAGETVAGSELHYIPGGKGANQAVAAARAGAATSMIGCLGEDGFAEELREFLVAQGVATANVKNVPGASGAALISVSDAGENQIVVVPGSNAAVSRADVTDVDLHDVAVAVSQFEIPVPTIEAFFTHCKANGVRTMLNTAPAIDQVGETLQLADVLLFNETELAKYAGVSVAEVSDPQTIDTAVRKIRARTEQVIVVTLGRQGLVAIVGDDQVILPGYDVDVVDTTGAGDCFAGYLAAALAREMSWLDAVKLANRAASISVTRHGAGPSMPSIEEVEL